MTCKFEHILARIVTNLAGTTGVSTRIYRSRLIPLQRNEFPAIVVEPVSSSASATSHSTLDWELQVRVIILVQGSTTTSPDQAVDSIMESMWPKMTTDLTLYGNAIDIEPTGTEFLMSDGDQPTGAITTNWNIRYRTELDDLTQ